jgi:hypothetical protein
MQNKTIRTFLRSHVLAQKLDYYHGLLVAGSATGGSVGDSIKPPATRGFWSIPRDLKNFYNPHKGSIGQFFETGPDAAAAAGSSGIGGSGIGSWLQGLFAGCS